MAIHNYTVYKEANIGHICVFQVESTEKRYDVEETRRFTATLSKQHFCSFETSRLHLDSQIIERCIVHG